jgi:hypothetical protein
MSSHRFHAALAAGVVMLTLATSSVPAHAQWIVYDPTKGHFNPGVRFVYRFECDTWEGYFGLTHCRQRDTEIRGNERKNGLLARGMCLESRAASEE